MLILSIVSCRSIKNNLTRHKAPSDYETNPVLVTLPEIGSESTKSVGDEIIIQGVGFLHDSIIISKDQIVSDNLTLHIGQYDWLKENTNKIRFENASDRGNRIAIVFLKNENVLQINGINEPDIQYEMRKTFKVLVDNFQRTLIYSGRNGNMVKFSYREFLNGMARAAFNHDVEYDLNQSSVISYKGASFEIIKADNSGITYKILSRFN